MKYSQQLKSKAERTMKIQPSSTIPEFSPWLQAPALLILHASKMNRPEWLCEIHQNMRQSNNKLSLTLSCSKGELSLISSVGIRVILVLFSISIFAGCDTVTGTKTPMHTGALSSMDNLEVQVRVDEDFSVILARNRRLNVNEAFWIGMLGSAAAGIVDSRRENEDAQRAKTFRMAIAELNVQGLAQKALVDGLQTSRRFASVTTVTEREEPSPPDSGILRVRIENWGLYAPSTENETLQQVQVGLNATASLVGGDGKLAWEHRDHFTGGVHHSIRDYGSSPAILKNEIEDTVRRYCGRVVNEIRYAK